VVLPGISEIRQSIDGELEAFTRDRASELIAIDPHLAPVAEALTEFVLDGGKRFRPIFAYLGYLGAGAMPSNEIIRACSALELVHVCALIHDDVMDGSDSRRNKPALHRRFEALHRKSSHVGDAERFGVASAILLGDLALSWSDQMIHESGIPESQLRRATPIFHEMRAELMAGQYLDVLEGAIGKSNLDRSRKIARYKSGRYSIERPLRFGAALAGASQSLQESLSEYGLPLGEAFQLRDDILGVFGNTEVTGKPSGDDIREGKRTVLIALTAERTSLEGRAKIESSLGNLNLDPSQVAEIQRLIEDSGALSECEELIEVLLGQALSALEHPEMNSEIAKSLREMAIAATRRKS
jgi:geranylgeranyl diphosphate synthase type I